MKSSTMDRRRELKILGLKHITEVKKVFSEDNEKVIIADIGANIGYYAESFLEVYEQASVHAYEPHPLNLQQLSKLKNNRLQIHPYGLFDSDGKFELGVDENELLNNGTYSIYRKTNTVEVIFKHADNELIRPTIVKIDVEGAESNILNCAEFFSKTEAILVEIVYKDDFGKNEEIIQKLKSLGFKFNRNLGKNDQLWLK